MSPLKSTLFRHQRRALKHSRALPAQPPQIIDEPVEDEEISDNQEEIVEDETPFVSPPRKKRRSEVIDENPDEPLTIRELGLPLPQFQLVLAEGQASPSPQWHMSLQSRARKAFNDGQTLPVPAPEYSPFFLKMRGNLDAFDAAIRQRKQYLMGDEKLLLRTKDAGMWWRDLDHQQASENRTRRWAAGSIYYYSHKIPVEYHQRLNTLGRPEMSDNNSRWA